MHAERTRAIFEQMLDKTLPDFEATTDDAKYRITATANTSSGNRLIIRVNDVLAEKTHHALLEYHDRSGKLKLTYGAGELNYEELFPAINARLPTLLYVMRRIVSWVIAGKTHVNVLPLVFESMIDKFEKGDAGKPSLIKAALVDYFSKSDPVISETTMQDALRGFLGYAGHTTNKTNRQVFEAVVGGPLEDDFFTVNGLDPDAPYTEK